MAGQGLFRVHYSGPEGSGGLRLVLRLQGAARFQLVSADTLGRSLWSVEVDEHGSLLIDHRQRTYCRGDSDLRLAEPTLGTLSLASLPSVLLGRLPRDVEDLRAELGSDEITDSSGRRWRVRYEDNMLVAWTLWADKTPSLWWTRQAKGGILSHRDGSQFRWRQLVFEPLSSELQELSAPADFIQVQCDEYDIPEFRKDQSEPSGSG